MKLRVCSLYPELMNIYADRGNMQLLRAAACSTTNAIRSWS